MNLRLKRDLLDAADRLVDAIIVFESKIRMAFFA